MKAAKHPGRRRRLLNATTRRAAPRLLIEKIDAATCFPLFGQPFAFKLHDADDALMNTVVLAPSGRGMSGPSAYLLAQHLAAQSDK